MSGNLKYQFAKLSIVEKLIAINVVVFLLNAILVNLFRFSYGLGERWMELPSDFLSFIKQPWSIITYSFFHSGIGHIFWNMLVLYFFGRTFLNLFGGKRFLSVYFLGIIAGGLLFMIGYNVVPALVGINSVLVGASAGVTAVLIFVCAYLPNQTVRLFIIDLKLWHIGVIVVLMDLFRLSTGQNVGGMLAHLGGAALGYFYATQLTKGKDIGAGFEKLIDSIVNIFKRDKKAKMKTVYKSSNPKKSTVDKQKEGKQRKIDAILDKISKSGYDTLTKTEKEFLFKQGKK